MNGSLALVGSGEYLPAMAEFEKSLIVDGVKNQMKAKFVQIQQLQDKKVRAVLLIGSS